MPKKPPRESQPDGPDLLLRLLADMTGKDSPDVGALVRALMSVDPAAGFDAILHRPRPNRRRPRRADEVTYRVRVDLKGMKPPVWRRLEISSETLLDQVHQVIQVAFGWTDSHLHRFAVGTSVWDRDAELYLCPFDVEEGEDEGTPEQEVRLDEVLVDVGDKLLYVYDYGDGWEHVLRLEAILDRESGQPVAVCTDGRRAGPPEDCGGPWGYQELVSEGSVDAEDFDVDDVNAELSSEAELAEAAASLSGPLASVLARIRGYPVEHELTDLIREARLDEPVLISAQGAAEMVRRYAWLLERVGGDGIELTSAGYLPPADVEAAMSELELTDEWVGKFNREVQTLPVLELRESAQKMGLLRKYHGRLLLTREAQKLRGNPVQLWWHIAGRLPPSTNESISQHAGLVSLLGAAAGRDLHTETFDALINDVLTSLGWHMADGAALDPRSGPRAAHDTSQVLSHLGAFGRQSPSSRVSRATSGGAALARAALQRAP